MFLVKNCPNGVKWPGCSEEFFCLIVDNENIILSLEFSGEKDTGNDPVYRVSGHEDMI